MSIFEYSGFFKNVLVSVLDIVGCQGNLADGNKTYWISICNKFLNRMKEIDPEKTYQI